MELDRARSLVDAERTHVQQLLADKEGLYTGHPEVTYPADKPKLKDLKILSTEADELEKRNAEIKKRFTELFGA